MIESECKIVLVDDHSLFRTGLRGLIEGRKGLRVVAEASCGEEFLALLPGLENEVVFMDFSMPGINGAETTERSLAVKPGLKVIALSMFGEERYYSRMVEAGAKGFLMKDSPFEEVIGAIEAVREGGTYFCEQLLRSLASRMQTVHSDREESEELLSTREIEILVCVCRGLSNQEIAEELFISKRTVDKHRANILEKTGCKNTASLVVYAIKHGLVDIL
ncbi:MAG TPA: response regulator transcription factor [Candidatus Alistipes avicola]|uniref:Response regulator transcription factor n=1 Tax=Candidatus Alistipes avicola TaxID=2838432 RepID=A0A9D2L437_9BACT|nr:response regulator transcription factor [uncultured Alistipes sp.]HJA98904.1 response regulator transcription factor [Candidatus Alistipes avicola]